MLAGLLTGLTLLPVRRLSLQVFHLPPQFLGLATQGFLLPALSGRQLLLLTGVGGELLLATRQFLQLACDLVHLLLATVGAHGRGVTRLVLVLLEVHLDLEHVGQITASLSATATAATLLHGDLDVVERGFGTQQVLQRLLLGLDGLLEIDGS